MDMQISSTQLRQNLSSILNKIEQDSLVCAIERKGHENIMMLPESDYNSIIETLYLLSSKSNREALEKSMAQVQNGQTVAFDNIEELDKYITNMAE